VYTIFFVADCRETVSKLQAKGERSGALTEPCLMKRIGDALEPVLASLDSALRSHGEARGSSKRSSFF
jgi:hypothetical protein